MNHLPLPAELAVEQAIARHWPSIDAIVRETGAAPVQIHAVMGRLEGLVDEDRPKVEPPHHAVLAAHTAYGRGDRTPEVIALQRVYDARRKRSSYLRRREAS